MAIHLSSPLGNVTGIGAKALKDFKQLGLNCVEDLLWHFPFRYDDFSSIKPIADLKAGETATVVATIRELEARAAKSRKLTIIEGVIEDETGSMKVVWFNQKYLLDVLRPGMKRSFAGTVENRFGLAMTNPIQEPAGLFVTTGRLLPIYPLTGSLTMWRVRDAIKKSLVATDELVDWLPDSIREAERFCPLTDAIRAIHIPSSKQELDSAHQRLKFDELFLHQLLFAKVRQERQERLAYPIQIDEDFLRGVVHQLPFTLTQAQKRATWEIVKDLAKEIPMNRLLEGDVGSGKTVVAAIAIATVLKQGYAVAYLAPTELLAAQQQAVLQRLIPNESIALLTHSQIKQGMEVKKRDAVIEAIQKKETRCVVGTHALLEKDIALADLALVVVDEQHRFGVEQRHALLETHKHDRAPHLLSMTATPIPRSLALTFFGDLDVSVLDEMPEGRKSIGTAMVPAYQHSDMWNHVQQEIREGHQVYIVCPLIDPSDSLGVQSVTEVFKELSSGVLKSFRTQMLHGKLKPDQKQEVITAFQKGECSALICTTVVEVGVDVPNATVMVIQGAERFGLAQLHQLRGRVGRSNLDSYCYLLSESFADVAQARLKALCKTQDGFVIAEKDLELRGPGDVFGHAQSGFPEFRLASVLDAPLMKKAREIATQLLQEDPLLECYPLVQKQINRSFQKVHLE